MMMILPLNFATFSRSSGVTSALTEHNPLRTFPIRVALEVSDGQWFGEFAP